MIAFSGPFEAYEIFEFQAIERTPPPFMTGKQKYSDAYDRPYKTTLTEKQRKARSKKNKHARKARRRNRR